MGKASRKINLPSPKEIKKIMETPGETRGGVSRWFGYVLDKKGEEGLKTVEKETKKLGFPIRHREIRATEMYPVGSLVVFLTAAINTFKWGEKELAEMAEYSAKTSFIIRFFMRHFLSPEKIFRATPRLWKRYFNIGTLEAADFHNIEKKGSGGYGIFRVKNFKLHPLHCRYLGYFFITTAKLTDSRFKEINIKETKCIFRGDEYHEYLLKWVYK